MEGFGMIRDKLDTKVLIIFVMTRAMYPASGQDIYDICFQDESVNYFQVLESLPQLVETSHLKLISKDVYEITELGKETSAITEDSLPYSLRQKVIAAVEQFNRKVRRSNFVKTEILPRNNNEFTVLLGLDDDIGPLLTVELMAPSQKQARAFEKAFQAKAERVYHSIMEILLEDDKKENL